jgi:nicotinamide riboside kinase
MEKKALFKVAILGAESSGKTWLTEKLAAHYRTSWVPEFAREYFNVADINNCTPDDLVFVAEEQRKSERSAIEKARKYLFSDTSIITIKIWSQLQFGHVPARINELSDKERFQLYLLTDNTVAWEQDRQRLNKFDRNLILGMNIQEILRKGSPYEVLRCNPEQRVQEVVEILKNY